MAKSIAQYTAEVSKSYDNSRKALQNQIDAISGNLEQTQKQINENYANQQNTLNNQRNQAASAASMNAGASGGSFGGAANIANKKYYEQTFVPAQTQLNTNQSQALENAQSQANSNRLSLESQMAAMNDEISRLGLQRYYDVLNQEREDAYRKKQLALQQQQVNAMRTYGSSSTTNTGQWGRGADLGVTTDAKGFYFYDAKGNPIKAATYVSKYGKATGETLKGVLNKMAQGGDYNAIRALAGLNNKNKQLTAEERAAFNILGISTKGYGSRA